MGLSIWLEKIACDIWANNYNKSSIYVDSDNLLREFQMIYILLRLSSILSFVIDGL